MIINKNKIGKESIKGDRNVTKKNSVDTMQSQKIQSVSFGKICSISDDIFSDYFKHTNEKSIHIIEILLKFQLKKTPYLLIGFYIYMKLHFKTNQKSSLSKIIYSVSKELLPENFLVQTNEYCLDDNCIDLTYS
jgi:hypothetical protein